jgi:hypothetical protein
MQLIWNLQICLGDDVTSKHMTAVRELADGVAFRGAAGGLPTSTTQSMKTGLAKTQAGISPELVAAVSATEVN